MNYAPCLGTVMCAGCADEHAPESLNESGLCQGCRVDLQLAIEAERAADLAEEADETLVERIVEQSKQRAKSLLPTTYSKAAS